MVRQIAIFIEILEKDRCPVRGVVMAKALREKRLHHI